MTKELRYSDYQRIIGNASEEISINTLYTDPVRDEQWRIVKTRPLVSSRSSCEAVQILRPFVSSRFMEQFKSMVPLAVYLVLFQLLTLRQLVEDSWTITASLLAVRDVGALHAAKTRSGRLPEPQLAHIVNITVYADKADEMFDFVCAAANIDRPGGGLVYLQTTGVSTPFELPTIPDEKA